MIVSTEILNLMSTEDTLLRAVIAIVAIIVLLPLFWMVLGMPVMGMWGWGHMGDGVGLGWGWLLSWFVMLALLVGLGYLFYRILTGHASESGDPALEELRLAYARGELTDEEFEERRHKLTGDE